MQANLENLKVLFRKMRDDGFFDADILQWGFYFLSKDKQALEDVYRELEGHRYSLTSIDQCDDGRWQMLATKVEMLDVEQLHRRNLAFNTLASHFEGVLYDGWDVEKLETGGR